MRGRSGGTAIVVGGSIAGLLTALLLRLDGWTVDVYERVDTELSGRGAGIVTHEALFAVMRAAHIGVPSDLGVKVRQRRVFDREGRCVAELTYPQILTSWDRLFHELRSKLPDANYHRGRVLARVEEKAGAVVARFEDGSRAHADLFVGADGFRSATRAQLFPDIQPNYAGYVAWRGLVEEHRISHDTRRETFDYFAFSLPEGEQMIGYPVAGANNDMRFGRRRYNWVWYRPAEEAVELRDLLTDVTGAVHDISIPPPLIRPDTIAAIRDAAARTLAPQFAELVQLTPQPFFQPIYDLETPRMAVGRIALLGDAAFVVRPHVGAGVTKAAQDALSLALSLRSTNDVAAALKIFEHDRMEKGAAIVNRARHLGAYMQAQIGAVDEPRPRTRAPAEIMRETASLDFLAEYNTEQSP